MAEYPQKGHDTMTVAALIHQLEQFDDDTEVIILNPNHEPYTIDSVAEPEDEENCEVVIYVGKEIKN